MDQSEKYPLSGEQLEQEMNSEAFLLGLEKTIGITKRTGREAGYVARITQGVFVYPDSISIGDEQSVNLQEGGMFSLSTQKRYTLETGAISPYSRVYYKVSRKRSDKKDRKEVEKYGKWLAQKNDDEKTAFISDFPKTQDWDDRLMRVAQREEDGYDVRGIGFTLHTHPERDFLIYPSSGDLRALHFRRGENLSRRSGFNPISIIVGSYSRTPDQIDRHHFMVSIQEKKDAFLDIADWNSLCTGFHHLMKSLRYSFIPYEPTEESDRVLNAYNILSTTFHTQQNKVVLNCGSWDEFAEGRRFQMPKYPKNHGIEFFDKLYSGLHTMKTG